ncbi:MAG: 16S rRNA processing protein RimM [Kofleriaceae bacterium]|nr:16S rRNA processing protein RimM [Kofleriaceae bacterium]MBP6838741.1 16S rRNA processing protein RimM [Kofleriaceae bacterium]
MRGEDRIEIGVISRAHGLRGEVVVIPHDPDGEALLEATQVWIGGEARVVTGCRPSNQGFLLAVEGVTDRTAAERLRGLAVALPRELLASDGELVLDDLIGCEARLEGGGTWGRVVAVELGPQDRLVIHDDQVERLLPMVPELVVEIDVAAGYITVAPATDWPSAPLARGFKVPARPERS